MRSDVQAELDRLEREGCAIRLSAGELGDRAVAATGEGMASCVIQRAGRTARAFGLTREDAAVRALAHWARMVGE